MTELSKECENGRLLRVLVKLGFVVERPHGDVVSGRRQGEQRLRHALCAGAAHALSARRRCTCVPVQDESWAETGDRYLLKLFRDFVFHQRVPEGSPGAGGPLLDWGYVIEALNKVCGVALVVGTWGTFTTAGSRR